MDIIVKAFLLGLSTGIFCVGFCLPVMIPIIFGDENSSLKGQAGLVFQFLSGRLIGYILFGAAAGYFGQKLSAGALSQKISAISMIILSLILIFYNVSRSFSASKIGCL